MDLFCDNLDHNSGLYYKIDIYSDLLLFYDVYTFTILYNVSYKSSLTALGETKQIIIPFNLLYHSFISFNSGKK